MGDMTTLTFGPFTRAISSVEPHLAPAECLASGSYNYLVSPVAGGAFKRSGSLTIGDTVSGTYRAVSGILESSPEYIPARLRSFKSDALADGALGGYPTHSVLYRKEASSTSWPAVDNGVFGTEYVRRAAANYVALSEFGSTAYPTTGGAMGGEIKYKVAPLWYESGDGGYMRGATELTRRFFASGSWNTVDAGRWRYYPNLRGTPLRWDGGCNDSSSSISNSIRVMPTGPLPPAWMPTLTETTSTGAKTTQYPWQEGTAFFYSVLYQFEDGSYSAPVIPRQPNATLTSGYGWKVLGSPGGTNWYKTVEWTGIPIGPSGTIARVLCRTRSMVMAAATTPVTVDISDLRVCGVLRNNTQTSYSDTLADDDGLFQDDDVVRFDTICPPRARYIGTGDNRVLVGYTLPNPLAIQIVVQQIGVTAFDQNLAEDSSATSAALGGAFSITGAGSTVDTLNLHSTNAGAAVVSTVAIALGSSVSLQSVVDQINATARDATHVAFRAQLAPGADPTAASNGLARTAITSVSSTSAASNALIVDDATYDAVPIGYYIYDSNGKVDGRYVTEKLGGASGSKQLQLSSAGTVGSAAALVFYCDTGDNSCILNGRGVVRCFGPATPSFIYFKRSALAGYDKPNKDRLYFTAGSPGAAATGVSIAPNLFVATNRRDGVNDPGQLMGFVDVQGAAVVAYRKRIGLFVNERGSNTGEDFDYRIQTINGSRGCISPWSLVSVNGCAVYATNVGLVATDKSKREIGLTADVYEPIRGRGEMSYEFPQCVAAAAADSGNCWMSGAAWGNRLVYSYRTAADSFAFSVYDFSLGTDSLGLESLANPDSRAAYGWSSPCFVEYTDVGEVGPRAMGAVSTANGLMFYGAFNDNAGTNDGRVVQLFKSGATTDDGATLFGAVYGRVVLAGAGTVFSARNVTVLSKIPYSGTQLRVLRASTDPASITLASSGSADYSMQQSELPQTARSPGPLCSVYLNDFQSGEGGLLWRVDVELEVLPTFGG